MKTMALNLPDRPEKPEEQPIPREFLYTKDEIKQRLIEGEQIFGVPGASLTWGIDGVTNGIVAAGGEGEKQVGLTLAAFAADNPAVRIFHSVEWPGSKGDTDHMLVIGKCVFIIDAKRWKSSRKYSVTAKGEILRGTVAFPEGKVKMIPAMQSWRKVLPAGTKVFGVVCIAQEKVFVPYDNNWFKAPYKLVTDEKLEEFLTKVIGKQKPEIKDVRDGKLMLEIASRVIKPRNRRSELLNLSAMNK